MTLPDLGYNDEIENHLSGIDLQGLSIGRIIAEHKERYILRTELGEFEAEVTGNLRYSASSREDFPAVGDWVAAAVYEDGPAIIHRILPRCSALSRQAPGHPGEMQLIAANIDYAFLVQAADRDFSINRLERYLALCYDSRVRPIILLTKTDLIPPEQATEIISLIKSRIHDVPILAISNETREGYAELSGMIEKGRTYCLLGSSGVGKSTLLNNLAGSDRMRTDEISQSTNKGRHTTSHRELFVLDSGGILIDNPGMREVGIGDAALGIEATFDRIYALSHNCKFRDCTHTTETGCSVVEAVDKGEIDRPDYENYLKLAREQAFFESTVIERRQKDREFGKMMKNYKKDLKKNKF